MSTVTLRMGLKQVGKGHKLDTRKSPKEKKSQTSLGEQRRGPVTKGVWETPASAHRSGAYTVHVCTQRVSSFVFFCSDNMNL